MSDDELVHERHGHVAVLRLNRPEARNALNPSLIHAIGDAVLRAEADSDIRAVVLTGTGERAFCGGMDLRSFSQGEGMQFDDAGKAFMRLMDGDVAVPFVGAANATAVAGGLELLLGCDVVVAAEGARFGLPEVQRGLIPGGGGTLLGARIPLALAMELVLTGDTIDAARALQIGLVNAVVPAGEVVASALGYAERIAANGPLAIRAARELVRLAAVDGGAVRSRLEHWRPVVFGSDDAREGATAFVEKRAPHWQGR
ncbi:MAG TPA: enoyl-CoA hydratase-related protein [Acidimicrobiales bacterium]|nr:enoyl-CoA hydratase-related protein [Acidimicrobiales bacterium]